MEEAPENGKGLSNSAHANGMNECTPPHHFPWLSKVPLSYLFTSSADFSLHCFRTANNQQETIHDD
jgi:hypothetical protein